MGIELRSNTQLESATVGQFDRIIKVYDDGIGPLWLCGEEFGPSWVIRAQSFESAYEIWTDERPTIDESELWEAYGFETETGYVNRILEIETGGDCPDLIEGYTYQSNSSGTGIVATGHYEWLHELDRAGLEAHNVRLTISTY